MFELEDFLFSNQTNVKIVGVGNKGCDSLLHLSRKRINGAELIAIDKDKQEIIQYKNSQNIQIINMLIEEDNAVTYNQDNEYANITVQKDVIKAMRGADMIFVLSDLTDSTDSELTTKLVSCAKNELGALTIAIVTLPSSLEGNEGSEQAKIDLGIIKENADAIIVISHKHICAKENTTEPTFNTVDQLIYNSIQSILGLLTEPGLVNLGLEDVNNILKDAGKTAIGIGFGTGDNASVTAVKKAVEYPMFDENIKNATCILLNITGKEENLSMFEVNEAANAISGLTSSSCNIIWGATVDNSLGDNIKAVVLAAGFDNS